jgi:hypothetical protein
MTGIDGWHAGHELGCATCLFKDSNAYGEPVCVIAQEFVVSGEHMTASVCPRSMQEQAA